MEYIFILDSSVIAACLLFYLVDSKSFHSYIKMKSAS